MQSDSRGDTLRRITKAALGGLAGCALIMGATQAASGESHHIAYTYSAPLIDLQPGNSNGPLDQAKATLRIMETPDEGTGFKLRLEGIDLSVAKPEFGGHLHVGPCEDPTLPTDPVTYGDPTSVHYKHGGSGLPTPAIEVWFNMVPTGSATATDEVWVPFTPADDGVMSVVLHRDPTISSTDTSTAGKAGPKEACLPVMVEDWILVTG
jgi:hypothetical protein